jgi:hypothetical protein
MGSTVASQTVHFAGSSVGILSTAALGIGAGIVLGRIAARALPARGRNGKVDVTCIVTAARWILDIAQVVFSRNSDGSLDIFLGGNSTAEEKEKLLVLELRIGIQKKRQRPVRGARLQNTLDRHHPHREKRVSMEPITELIPKFC